MSKKTYIPQGEQSAEIVSQIGATFEALAKTIQTRRDAGQDSYTSCLLNETPEMVLSKVLEETLEVVEAAQEEDADHLRYEIGDLLYHLLVVAERFNIPLDELAAELNTRMTDEERPKGGLCLLDKYVKRGK